MADISETSVTGRKYRRLVSTDDDGVNTWERISFWKMASDVILDDGTTLQTWIDNYEAMIS